MADNGGYRLGDVANGYVLTEHGWKPVESADVPQPPQYRIGDVANGYVLTEQGWVPLGPAAAQPTQPPAYQPAPGTGSRRGLWIALAVVAVVLLGGIAAVTVALVNARNTLQGVAAPSVTTKSAPASSPSPSGSPSASASSEGKAFRFGESAQLTLDGADAAEITVGTPVEFTSTNQFDKAEKGRFVYVPVTVKVTGKEKVSVNPFDFEVVLPDGQRLDVAFVAGLPSDAPTDLEAADVNPGETITGSVPFDVPAGTPLKVAYTPELEVLGTWQ